jgi:hypothetical protein
MLYQRRIFNKLSQQLKHEEIVVLTGMRRVGKTTLLKMIFDQVESSNKVFLDLENPIVQKVFSELDYDNIWNNLSNYGINTSEKAFIFLDEIQSMPEIVKVIKYLYDHYTIKFFVTGSSSFYLKNLFPESLSGRKIIFELFPLDFEEFLVFKGFPISYGNNLEEKSKQKNLVSYEKKKNYFEEYLHYGGFPQVVVASDVNRKSAMLNDIFTSYFEKEVRSLADFRNITVFRDLVFLLMQRIGSKLDISKIASTLGTSRQSIYSYLAFLEKTYFITLISPYSNNVDREISGTKKVYLCDTGFVNLFGKIDEGSLFENSVFNNITRLSKVNYYQRRSGSEIDFILPESKTAIEVKSKAIKQDINKLAQMAKALKMEEFFVISKAFVNEEKVIVAVNL